MAAQCGIEYTQVAGVPRSALSPFNGERLATKRPSYLKRQKEQQRLARAKNKREARRERKRARDEMNAAPEAVETDQATAETDGTTAETDGTTAETIETPHPPEATETG